MYKQERYVTLSGIFLTFLLPFSSCGVTMSGIYSLTQLFTLETCALLGGPGVSHLAFSCFTVALEILGHICLRHEAIVPVDFL